MSQDDGRARSDELLVELNYELRKLGLPTPHELINLPFRFSDANTIIVGAILGVELTESSELALTVSNRTIGGSPLHYLLNSDGDWYYKVTVDTGTGNPRNELLPGTFLLLE